MKTLGGRRIKSALLAGISWFGHFRKSIDKLNVFPVPDGDTGKNMHHAFQAAQKEIESVPGNSASEVAWAAARGALMGGRGCSGMILSGFFAGFAEGVGDRKILSAHDLALAFQVGCLRARERIDHPVEGTILSVGEAAARSALVEAKKTRNLVDVVVSAWKAAEEALQNTPKQLRILKENRVVDAGGMGLVYFLEGMVRFNFRQPLTADAAQPLMPAVPAFVGAQPQVASLFTFCLEFIIHAEQTSRQELRDFLQPWGEEIMLAAAEHGFYKVHMHVKEPETVLKRLAALGSITWQKIDDMKKQHRHAFYPGEV
ncbi:DAK2 domain-containing protein [candidate division FCPU426 bacterium]|nr:DAK2 domain-containing protein [candidate division FCPU426 bacterium]